MSYFAGLCSGVILAGFVVAAVNLAGSKPLDDTDNKTTGARSDMRVLLDHGTGCQYLRTIGGGLTPRLDASGQPICGNKQTGESGNDGNSPEEPSNPP